jgi:hypothetical protein
MLKKFTLGALAAVTAASAFPAAAQAQYYRDGYYQDRSYQGRSYHRPYRRCSGTTGTIIGGAGGALLGRELAGRGDRTMAPFSAPLLVRCSAAKSARAPAAANGLG